MIYRIRKTQYGLVFKCTQCNKIHIEFNNFNFNFSQEEYIQFAEYINSLDGDYWLEKNKNCLFQRKICIPIASSKVCMILNANELLEFKSLLSVSSPNIIDESLLTVFNHQPSLN